MASRNIFGMSSVRVLCVILIICMVMPLFTAVISAADTDVPTAPQDLVAEAGDGNVTLTWSGPLYSNASAVIGYNVYRCAAQGELSLLVTLDDVTTFMDVGLVNGVEYSYFVAAVNEAGEGERSQNVSVTPCSIPNRPLALMIIPGNLFLELNWTAPDFDGGSDILGYNVYREISGDWTVIGTVANQTWYVDPNLEIGVTYSYRVSAFNYVGEGTLSDAAKGAPDMAPGTVADLQAFSGVRNITLSWNLPEDNGGSLLEGFKVFRSTDLSNFQEIAVLGPTNSYVDLDLDDNLTYYYKISAFNAVGDGECSFVVYAGTYDYPHVTVNAVVPGDGTVTLYWMLSNSGGTDIKGYWWVYRGLNMSALSLYKIVLSDALDWTDEDVENGVTYYYQIAAENDVGIGISQTVSCTPMTTPEGPTSLTGTSRDNYVILTWGEPVDDGGAEILTYNIYKGTNSSDLEYIGTTPQMSYLVGGLEIDVEYYYQVKAVNKAGEGDGSNIISIASGTTPSAPLNLTYAEGDEFVQLDWDPSVLEGSTDIDHYSVFRANSTGVFTVIANTTATNYNDTSVTNYERYTYYVTAANSIGYGARTAKVTAYPHLDGTVPDAPLNVTALAGEDYILITWNESYDGGQPITGYVVYRGVTNETMYYYKTVTETEVNHTGLALGLTYYYKVAAVNAIGTGNFSDVVNATTVKAPTVKSEDKSILDSLKSMIIYIIGILAICVVVLLLIKKKLLRRRRKKKPPVQNKTAVRPAQQLPNVQQKKK